MKTLKIVSAVIWVFIQAPIFFYLCYKVLKMVEATELMMFLFWVYVPISLIIGTVVKLTSSEDLSK